MSNINVNNITPQSGNTVSVSGSLTVKPDDGYNNCKLSVSELTSSISIINTLEEDHIPLRRKAIISSSATIVPSEGQAVVSGGYQKGYNLGTRKKKWHNVHACTASINHISASDSVGSQNFAPTSLTVHAASTQFTGDVQIGYPNYNNSTHSTDGQYVWNDIEKDYKVRLFSRNTASLRISGSRTDINIRALPTTITEARGNGTGSLWLSGSAQPASLGSSYLMVFTG